MVNEKWWVRCEKWWWSMNDKWHLPHESNRGPSGGHARAARPGGSVYLCVQRLHAKGSGGHARRSSSRRLCVLRLPRERQPWPQRRPRAPQLVQEALCTALATRKAAAAPAAATRAAARPGGSVYCACHAKGSLLTTELWWVVLWYDEWGVRSGAVTSGDVISDVKWKVRCEKWSCEEWSCDEPLTEWVSEWVRRRRRRRRSPGGTQAKNKNPTQWCGEL